MAQAYQFPKNYDRFLEMGQNDLKQKKTKEAIACFQQAYAITPSFSLNFFIASLFAEQGAYREARSFIRDYRSEYLAKFEYMTFYLEILIEEKDFLTANAVINEQMLNCSNESLQPLVNLKRYVKSKELIYQQAEQWDLAKVKAKLLALPEVSVAQQLESFSKAFYLPQSDYLEICQVLLASTRVHSLVKSRLLEKLVVLNSKKTFRFAWIDQKKYSVVPAAIELPQDDPLYLRTATYLKVRLLSHDPILYHDLLEEFKLQFALLWPFPEKRLESAEIWVKAYLLHYSSALLKYHSAEEKREIERAEKFQEQLRLSLADWDPGNN